MLIITKLDIVTLKNKIYIFILRHKIALKHFQQNVLTVYLYQLWAKLNDLTLIWITSSDSKFGGFGCDELRWVDGFDMTEPETLRVGGDVSELYGAVIARW